jgi:hypothetical protein
MILTTEDTKTRYEQMTGFARVFIRFTTDLVGGVPADDEGIRAFVKHQYGLTGEEAEKAVLRIKSEELGEKKLDAPEGELDERLSYGLTQIRRSSYGPYLGNWMVKACIKVAASRLGVFVKTRGSKGDIAEMGQVSAIGGSLHRVKKYTVSDGDPSITEDSNLIHLYVNDAVTIVEPAPTEYRTFRGRVSTPSGSMSIVGDKEYALPGCRAAFEFRYFKGGKLTDNAIADIISSMGVIGLGSAKAFECGKFVVERAEINEEGKG